MNSIILTNENYCATIIRIHQLIDLDDLDNLKGVSQYGFQALVNKDYSIDDLYVLFTAECQLDETYCKENNLFDKPELNKDPNKKGYINSKRRVRTVKLRGHISSALLMPISSLSYLCDVTKLKEGDMFNIIDNVELCKKYVIKHSNTESKKKASTSKLKYRALSNTKSFPEHFDTMHWLRNEHKIDDDQEIIVTAKLHGSSFRACHQQVMEYKSWAIPFLTRLYKAGYGNWKIIKFIAKFLRKNVWRVIAGSRRVVKMEGYSNTHYYDSDIWNQKLSEIGHLIPKNWVIYGELIGWAGDKPIQKGYTYDVPNGKCHLYVYRISIVNEDGISVDLSQDQMAKWCLENGLKTCPELWRGPKHAFKYEQFMDTNYVKDGFTQAVPLSKDSPCDEGVVIRIEGGLTPEHFKCKAPLFLGHETKVLDTDESLIE